MTEQLTADDVLEAFEANPEGTLATLQAFVQEHPEMSDTVDAALAVVEETMGDADETGVYDQGAEADFETTPTDDEYARSLYKDFKEDPEQTFQAVAAEIYGPDQAAAMAAALQGAPEPAPTPTPEPYEAAPVEVEDPKEEARLDAELNVEEAVGALGEPESLSDAVDVTFKAQAIATQEAAAEAFDAGQSVPTPTDAPRDSLDEAIGGIAAAMQEAGS